MNRRRQLLVSFLLAPLAARAQPRIVKIGFLALPIRLDAFRQGMRTLGYADRLPTTWCDPRSTCW